MPHSIKIAVLDDYQRNAESFANWSSPEPAAKTAFFHDNVSDLNQLVTRQEGLQPVEAASVSDSVRGNRRSLTTG